MKAYNEVYKIIFAAMILVVFSACGGNGENKCDPIAQTGCSEGLVCEDTADGETGCFPPLVIRGLVFDLATDDPVEGAHVVARDANSAVASNVAVTDANGAYELTVTATRSSKDNPTPIGESVTLRADAAAYQTFPGGVRSALPISTSNASEQDNQLLLESALTTIGLIPLEEGAGTGSIQGQVDIPADSAGALVVAELDPETGFNALAGRDGQYTIFNLPAGDYSVTAYAQGVNYNSTDVNLSTGESETVDLDIKNNNAGRVEGTVQIVNAPGDAVTSVILAVESTFNEDLARGETPPGLRAPAPGTNPDITGPYEISGVPAGNYVVLAAFENDELVRDPDLSISGTSLLHISVDAGATTTVEGFKVTEALDVISPGADTPEAVTEPLTLEWADDSSEDEFEVIVLDTFGNTIWTTTVGKFTGSGNPSVLYAGPSLEPGLFYQFRVTSKKAGIPISQTEDLKGVFFVE